MTLVSCTVARNQVSLNPYGGGLYSAADESQRPLMRNSVFADNIGPRSDNGPDIYGNVRSEDYNLIERPTGFDLIGPGDHNITGQDPLLRSLADNGGDTQTHALQPESPAINAGSCTDIAGDPIASDQRGVARPQGIQCDMGAYESQPHLVLTKAVDNSLPQPGQRITFTITVENSGALDASGGAISDTLPVGLMLAGPIVLDPPTAGVIGSEPILAADLTIPLDQEVRVSFPVTVGVALPAGTRITNTASVTSSEIGTYAWGNRTIVVASGPPAMVYLPLLASAYP
jgi:uncharacterized repeat protein (TIGR01451 family)